MSDAITRHINSSVQKAYEWLADLELELGTGDRQVAYRALRSVMHALRDRLPVEEATHLAAELPMILRGLFYEGWQLAHKPEKLSLDSFLERVVVNYDAPEAPDPMRVARAVLALFKKRISAGEIKDVRQALPQDLQELWQS